MVMKGCKFVLELYNMALLFVSCQSVFGIGVTPFRVNSPRVSTPLSRDQGSRSRSVSQMEETRNCFEENLKRKNPVPYYIDCVS